MNLAEQILRRKHEAMYKQPVVHPSKPSTTAPEDTSGQQQAPSVQQQSASGADAILTRDGRKRCVRWDTKRTDSTSDINVDLYL